MSNVFQTQCPTCQHTFAITQEQLLLKNGYARCGSCQSIFSADKHIIGTVNTPSTAVQSVQLQTTLPTTHQPSTHNDGLDLLFDDSAGLDENGQLVRQQVTKADAYSVNARRPSHHSTTSSDFEILENFDDLNIPLSQPTKPQHISQDQNYDDSWVKDLLGTETDNTPAPKKSHVVQNQPAMPNFGANPQAPNEVVDMLENMGVNVVQERMPTTQEYREKINSRFEKQQSSQHEVEESSGGMGIVWFLGSLLLAGTLLLQYVFFNIDNLVKDSEKASTIGKFCGMIPTCKLPIADINQLDIKSQSLISNKAEQSDLIFTIQNKGSEKSIYPNLKVSLRNGNDTFAQFIMTPQQYLGEDDGKYLLPQQVHPVKLRINKASNKSSQANIEAFY